MFRPAGGKEGFYKLRHEIFIQKQKLRINMFSVCTNFTMPGICQSYHVPLINVWTHQQAFIHLGRFLKYLFLHGLLTNLYIQFVHQKRANQRGHITLIPVHWIGRADSSYLVFPDHFAQKKPRTWEINPRYDHLSQKVCEKTLNFSRNKPIVQQFRFREFAVYIKSTRHSGPLSGLILEKLWDFN